MRQTAIGCIIVVLLGVAGTPAFNHPEIKWKSVTTDHFVINYYDRTEPALYAAWKIAEEAYATLAEVYRYESTRKIALSLADYDDYSNGWADWLSGSIMIWVPDARFELRGNPTWLRNVIVHELAHIMSLHQRRKTQVLDWTLSLSYNSPSATVSYQEPFARLTLLPDWLAEGVAQMGADTMGSDCWDARRDMVLRTAALSGRQLALAEMGHFNHDGLGSEMVYNQGYSLSSYVARSMGLETFQGMFVSAGGGRFDFEEYFAIKSGKALDRFYQLWLDSVRTAGKALQPAEPSVVEPVWRKGFLNALPRVSRNGRFWGWLTNHRDDGYRTDLVICPAGSSRVSARIDYAQTSWDFSPDGNTVYYVKARRTDSNGSFYNDIYSAGCDGRHERRLTRGARAYDIAVSPDGASLAVTRFANGRFGLYQYTLASGEWTELIAGTPGAPILYPAFNPSAASQVAFTRSRSGNTDIVVYDISSRAERTVVASAAQEELGTWASDGRLYFSADHGGIYNVYSVDPTDSASFRRETKASGGMFAPCLTREGRLLVADYTEHGYGIATLAPEHAPFTMADPQNSCAFSTLPAPRGAVVVEGVDYRPRLLRAYLEMLTYLDVYIDEPASYGARMDVGAVGTGLSIFRGDALGKKFLGIGIYAGLEGGAYYGLDTTAQELALRRTRADLTESFQALVNDSRRGANGLLGPRRTFGILDAEPGRSYASGDEDSAGLSESGFIPPSIGIQPSVFYENAKRHATWGFTVLAALTMSGQSMMPFAFMGQQYTQWHLMRDLYLGLSPYAELYPMYGSYYVSVPLWLQYLRMGHYEEDYSYTMRDILTLQVFGGPEMFPAGEESTGNAVVGATTGGAMFAYGVPIARSSSLVLKADGAVTNGEDLFKITSLGSGGLSDLYVVGSLGARFVFPIVKTINSGRRLYADALYASLSYDGSLAANRAFIFDARQEDVLDVLSDADASDDASVSHTVGASLTMGTYKKYLFFRTLSLSGRYEVLSGDVFVDVGFGF